MAGFFGFNTALPPDADLAPIDTGLNEEEEDALNDETFGDFDPSAAGDFSFGAPSTSSGFGGIGTLSSHAKLAQTNAAIPDALSSSLTDIIGGGMEDFMDQLLREEDGGSASNAYLTGKSMFDAQSWDNNLLTPEQIQSAWGASSKTPSIWKTMPSVSDEYDASQRAPIAPVAAFTSATAPERQQLQQPVPQQQQQQQQPPAQQQAPSQEQDKDSVAELLAKLTGAMSVDDLEAKLQKEFSQQAQLAQQPAQAPSSPQAKSSSPAPQPKRPRLKPEEAAALRQKQQQAFAEQMAKINQSKVMLTQQAGHHQMLLQKVSQQLNVLGQQHQIFLRQERERMEREGAPKDQAQPKADAKFEAQRTTLMQQMHVHKAALDHAARSLHQLTQQQIFLDRQFQDQQIALLPLMEQKAYFLKQQQGVQQSLNTLNMQITMAGTELQSLSGVFKHSFEKTKANPSMQNKMELASIQQRQQLLSRQLQMLSQQKHNAVIFLKNVQMRLKSIEQEEKVEKQSKDPRAQLYNNLMTEEEKQFLVRIQLKQLQSENPYLDDFYFHTLMEHKTKQAAAMGKPLETALPIFRHRVIPGAKPFKYHTPASSEYTPQVDSGHSLGTIAPYNLRTARQLISGISHIHKEVDESSSSASASKAEAAVNLKRMVLLRIEEIYAGIVDVEDLDKRIAARRESDDLIAERGHAIDKLYTLFGFSLASSDVDESVFLRILSINKGRKALKRALLYMNASQILSVLVAVIRNATALQMEEQKGSDSLSSVSGGLSQVLDRLTLSQLIVAMETALQILPKDQQTAAEALGPFGGAVIYAVTRRADQTLTDSNPTHEDIQKWISTLVEYAKTVLPVFVHVCEKEDAATAQAKLPYMWQLTCFFLAHAGGSLNELFKEKLSPFLAAEDARTPPMKQFASYVQGQ